jgi:hypothetical protein
VADENVILDRDPLADEGVARDFAAFADRGVFLDLNEGADLGLIADFASGPSFTSGAMLTYGFMKGITPDLPVGI